MCDPVTLAVGSLAATVVSTGASVYGQMKQGEAAQAQAGYQSAIMRNNQQTAEMLAADATARGKIAEAKQREKTRQMIGTQTAALAGQGTDISGSALDILGDTSASGEFDALTIRSNAAREAWGYKAKGAEYGAIAARPGPPGGELGAGASLLAGGGAFADKWYRYYNREDALSGGRGGGNFLQGHEI